MSHYVPLARWPGSPPRRKPTSQLICELRPSLDIRGLRSEPPIRTLPDGRRVAVSSTPLPFGGVRWWLHCPDCHRRCLVLYASSCRVCLRAVHKSTTLSPLDRLFEKATAIRWRLGQRGGGLRDPFPPRPKHMKARTYRRLRLECSLIQLRLVQGWSRQLGLEVNDDDPFGPEPEEIESEREGSTAERIEAGSQRHCFDERTQP